MSGNPFIPNQFPLAEMMFDGWIPWTGGVCPVPPTTRIEVVQELRHARGLALSFDWVQKFGPRAVFFWRLERPL